MKKYIFFYTLIIFCCTACTNDEVLKTYEPPTPTCDYSINDFSVPGENKDSSINLINCWGGLENYIYVNRYGYFYPCFNPNNKEEIAYMRKDHETFTGCNFEIWVLNYCTGETRFLTDGICYSIDWSVKDWIVFTGEDRQLWKIKSDGDSLTQLTNSGSYNNFATWNKFGNKIGFKKEANPSAFIIADEQGNTLETIDALRTKTARHWSMYDKISCATGTVAEEFRPAYYNLESEQFHELPPVDATQHGFIYDTDWINENKILWLATWLIGATDIHSHEVTEIDQGYENRLYHNLAVSSDGELIVVEQEDQFQISDCDIEVEYNLYIMNADGSEKRRINVPE